MGEYASRGRSLDRGVAPRAYVETPAPAPRSAAEQASDRAMGLARDVTAVAHALDSVHQAAAANDPERWHDAKQMLDRQLATARNAREQARSLAADATLETRHQLAASEAAHAEHERAASTLTEPPHGWHDVSREAEILAIVSAPIEGSARDGWARKMASLTAELAQLSAVESRRLAVRLHKQQANDPLATALAPGVRITRERFAEVIAFLDGARRREAMRAAYSSPPTVARSVEPDRESSAPPTALEAIDRESSTPPAAAEATDRAPVVADPETLDMKLKRILETSESDATIELHFSHATADLDGTTRRALARRLELYRPGGGDEIAARFLRLDRPLRQQLCNNLRAETTALVAASPSAALADPQPMDMLRLQPAPETAVAPGASTRAAKQERAIPDEATRIYLQTNSNLVWRAIRSHLHETSWPAATAQFTWLQPRAFVEAVVGAIHDQVMASAKAGDIDLVQLDALLYPLRVHDELAGLLPIQTTDDDRSFAPSKHWVPAIGLRLGQLVQAALVPSVVRMTQRYVDATNARAEQARHEIVRLEVRDLIASSPLDRVVARGLVGPGIAEVVPDGSVRPKGRTSQRPVGLTWEGAHDPHLWCWVRADLADATVEEVAASLFGYARDQTGEATSYYAYGIAAAAPLFGLPASWAVQFPDARTHAPDSVKQGTLPDSKSDSIATRLAGLAATDAADAIALHQAAGMSVDKAEPTAVLAAMDDTVIQLGALRAALAPWDLAGEIVPVLLHAVAKRDALHTASAHDIQAYAAVAFGQRARLGSIAGSVAAASAAAGKLSASSEADNPIRPILARYAQAAASARLAITCEDLVTGAQDMQRALVIKALQVNQLAATHAMGELQAGPAMRDPAAPKDERSPMQIVMKVPAEMQAPRTSSRSARELSRPHLDVQDRARVLENTLLQGGEVDPDELQRVQLESQEIALRARIENLAAHLQVIDDEANKADAGLAAKLASLGSSRFRGLRDASQAIRAELVIVRRDLILDQKMPRPRSGDGDGLTPPPLDILAKRDALAHAQARFAKISEDRDLGTYLERAYDVIGSQRLRTAVVNVLASIGLSFVGAGMASVLAKGAARAFTTAQGVKEVTELSLAARAGIFATRAATETIVGSAAQVALTGDEPWKALVENALLTLGMEGTMGVIARDAGAARAFHKQLSEQVAQLEAIEAKAVARSAKLGTASRALGREALAFSGQTVMGMALGALAGKILAELDGKHAQAAGGIGWEDAILHGASVAIGRLAHARLRQRRPALDDLA
ncbi:MAG: hypothetical protein M3619_26640, partial [Myxococcota bacterium]|nr:hypothetical protein [Myxococcota bacterium]